MKSSWLKLLFLVGLLACQETTPTSSNLAGQCHSQSGSACLENTDEYIDSQLKSLYSRAGKSKFYGANGEVDWAYLNKSLDAPTPLKVMPNLQPSIPGKDYYTLFDLLFISNADLKSSLNRPFPPEFLPKIRAAWNFLETSYRNGTYQINGDLMVQLRDQMVKGVKEGGGSPSDENFLLSFDEYWDKSLSSGGAKNQPKMGVSVEQFRSKKLMGWLADYHEWIDLQSLKTVVTSLPPFIGNLTEEDEVDLLKQIDAYIESSPSGVHKIELSLGQGYVHMGVQKSFVNEAGDASELRAKYKTLVQDIFAFDRTQFPDKLAHGKQFLKALNIHNYFHVLNNGMGRVYMLLLQFESLVNQWPMHIFMKHSVLTYTNYLGSVDHIFRRRVRNNVEIMELMQKCH